KSWFTRQKKKFLGNGLINDLCPIEEEFMRFSQELAHEMIKAGVTSLTYMPHQIAETAAIEQGSWNRFFSEEKVEPKLTGQLREITKSQIREGCPLMKIGNHQFAFLHKSLLEYFAAKQLFEGVLAKASIALGYELNDRLLTNEPNILYFLAEQVQQNNTLKAALFELIRES